MCFSVTEALFTLMPTQHTHRHEFVNANVCRNNQLFILNNVTLSKIYQSIRFLNGKEPEHCPHMGNYWDQCLARTFGKLIATSERFVCRYWAIKYVTIKIKIVSTNSTIRFVVALCKCLTCPCANVCPWSYSAISRTEMSCRSLQSLLFYSISTCQGRSLRWRYATLYSYLLEPRVSQ